MISAVPMESKSCSLSDQHNWLSFDMFHPAFPQNKGKKRQPTYSYKFSEKKTKVTPLSCTADCEQGSNRSEEIEIKKTIEMQGKKRIHAKEKPAM